MPPAGHRATVEAGELAAFDKVKSRLEADVVTQARLVDRAVRKTQVGLGATIVGAILGRGPIPRRARRIGHPEHRPWRALGGGHDDATVQTERTVVDEGERIVEKSEVIPERYAHRPHIWRQAGGGRGRDLGRRLARLLRP